MNKFICLPLVFVFCFSLSFAQDVSPEQYVLYISSTPDDNINFHGMITLYNSSSRNIKMEWVREHELQQGWQSSVCDQLVCYPKTTSTATFTIGANDSNYLNVHFYPNGKSGTGKVTLKVSEVDEPSSSFSLTYYGNAYPASVTGNEEGKIKLFPNPNTGKFVIRGAGGKVNVFGLDGSKLSPELDTGQNEISIRLEGAPAGIYLIEIEEQGRFYRKLIVKQ